MFATAAGGGFPARSLWTILPASTDDRNASTAEEPGVTDPTSSEEHSEEYEVVFTANGEAEAHGIKCALDAAGIPARMKVQAATKLFPVTVDGLGAVKILVPADRLDEARELIDTPASPASSEE